MHVPGFAVHESLLTDQAFLIAARPELEIELTRAPSVRKHFLIASGFTMFLSAPHRDNPLHKFLIATSMPFAASPIFPCSRHQKSPSLPAREECDLLGSAGGANLPGGVGPNWLADAG
jgi:hypothetical protein